MFWGFFVYDELFLSWCFQNSLIVFGFWQLEYNMSWYGSLCLLYLAFIELLQCVYLCFSSDLGSFIPLFLQITLLLLYLSIFSSWDSYSAYVDMLDGVPWVPQALFIFLHSSFSFLFLWLYNFNLHIFKVADPFICQFNSAIEYF